MEARASVRDKEQVLRDKLAFQEKKKNGPYDVTSNGEPRKLSANNWLPSRHGRKNLKYDKVELPSFQHYVATS